MDESEGPVLKLTTLQLGGAVAQLGARLDGIEEVVGSNPIGSTNILECLIISISSKAKQQAVTTSDKASMSMHVSLITTQITLFH